MGTAFVERITVNRQELLPAESGKQAFLLGEQYRIRLGCQIFVKLIENAKVRRLLEIKAIPDYDLEKEMLNVTQTLPFEATVTSSTGTSHRVVGLRHQLNFADPTGAGRKAGLITSVGGGIRFVWGEGVQEGGNVRFANDEAAVLEDISPVAQALGSAMGPKNWGLNFQRFLNDALVKMGKPDLVDKVIYKIGGGSKGELTAALAEGEQLTNLEKEEIKSRLMFRAGYQWELDPHVDKAGGDMGTQTRFGVFGMTQYFAFGIEKAAEDRAKAEKRYDDPREVRGGVTGKDMGSLEARGAATGLGVIEGIEAYAQQYKINLAEGSWFVRGCGGAAERTIQEAYRRGYKVNAIAAISKDAALLVSKEGFNDKDAEELREIYDNGKSLIEWATQKQIEGRDIEAIVGETGPDMVKVLNAGVNSYWEVFQPKVIVESAKELTVNEENAKFIPEDAILAQGGNGVVTPIAAEILKDRHVADLTGICLNAGGIDASFFEHAQDELGIYFSTEVIEAEIKSMMYENISLTKEIIDLAAQNGFDISFAEAFYMLAISRGVKERAEVEEYVSNPNENVIPP